jgi:hypothetical protein
MEVHPLSTSNVRRTLLEFGFLPPKEKGHLLGLQAMKLHLQLLI